MLAVAAACRLLLIAGCWLLAAGCWMLAAGWLLGATCLLMQGGTVLSRQAEGVSKEGSRNSGGGIIFGVFGVCGWGGGVFAGCCRWKCPTVEGRRWVVDVLAAGCWLLAAGCWSLAAGCWLLLLLFCCWLLAAGCWLLVADCLLLADKTRVPLVKRVYALEVRDVT